jgi:CRP-like cAMP-binding protein
MTQSAIRDWLRTVSLFSALSTDELDALASASRSVQARKGSRLFEEGAAADCCYVLVSGGAKLVLAGHADTEVILGTLRPQALVGEIALLDGSTRSADLVATEDSRLIRIPARSFDTLRTNLQFETRLVAHVTSLLREANDQVRGTAAAPALSRVGWCLARLARREGVREGAHHVIPKRPHQELAEITGCTRETVTRALATLKRRKCVTWDDDSYRIDLAQLQQVVRQDLHVGPAAD